MKTTKEFRDGWRTARPEDHPPEAARFIDYLSVIHALLADLDAAEARAAAQDGYAHQCEVEIVALRTEVDTLRARALTDEEIDLVVDLCEAHVALSAFGLSKEHDALRSRLAALLPKGCATTPAPTPQEAKPCPGCEGSGHAPYFSTSNGICPHCHGTGKVTERDREKLRAEVASLRARAFSDEELALVAYLLRETAPVGPRGATSGDLDRLRLGDRLRALGAGQWHPVTGLLPKGGAPSLGPCPDCDGSGRDLKFSITTFAPCPRCHGTGKVSP